LEEQDFWLRLEHRIEAEFSGFADRKLRYYWCDGLVPDEYDLVGTEPRISGLAYCGSNGQDRWRFTLVVGQRAASVDQIDWAALLPSERLTGWLTPDTQEKTLRIDPLAGYDDESAAVAVPVPDPE
jgi:hypothetical protein